MLINGIKADKVDAKDRGLAYGDGLFSTIKVVNGKTQLWDLHLQRLQLGAERLFFPDINWQKLSEEVATLAKAESDKNYAVIKVMLTRGSGGRGYSAAGCQSPQRIIFSSPFPEFYCQWQKQGIDIILCETQLATNPQLAGLKTLNRLEQVLIKQELENKQAVEGIVCDAQGYVIEACSANLFIYLNQQWVTPKLDRCGVAGVQRRNLLMLAKKAGIKIVETDIHQQQLKAAEAICLTNALMGIVPVKQYQMQQFSEQGLQLCGELQLLLAEGAQ